MLHDRRLFASTVSHHLPWHARPILEAQAASISGTTKYIEYEWLVQDWQNPTSIFAKVTKISGEKNPDCTMSEPVLVKDPTQCTKALFNVKKVGTIRSLYFQYVDAKNPVKCFVESTNHPCEMTKLKGNGLRDFRKAWFWKKLWQDKTWHQSSIVFKKRWAKLSLPMSLKLEGFFWVLPVGT